MEEKSSIYSKTVKTANILPPDANAIGTLFGGKLMAHIDDVAAIAAIRHARKQIVTASTDSVDFLRPVRVGDAICLEATVIATHHTSMEVFVSAIREGLLEGEQEVCATAYLTFVALDETGKPTEVPSVYHEREQEKLLEAGASLRRERRNERKKQSQSMATFIREQLHIDGGKVNE